MPKFAIKKADGTAISHKDIKKGDKVTVVRPNGSEHTFVATKGAKTDEQRKAIRDEFESTKAARMATAATEQATAKASRASARASVKHADRAAVLASRKAKREAAMAPRKAARAQAAKAAAKTAKK